MPNHNINEDNMTNVQAAVDRLNIILPLFANQQKMSTEAIVLHRLTLCGFVNDGAIPNRQKMLEMAGGNEKIFEELAVSTLVVFNNEGEPTGAYPFTMDRREYRVSLNGHTVNAMCALDALSIHAMYHCPVEINSVCAVTGKPVSIFQRDGKVVNNQAGGIYFGINWQAASSGCSCADSLCTEMIFLKDKNIAQQWLQADSSGREIFTLDEAIIFGSRFFMPLV